MKIAEMLMLYLTYEELKQLYFSPFSFTIYVVPYLWGIETPNTFSRITVAITSLYLTYEELKHVSFLFTNSLCPPCCTLPMRNWNNSDIKYPPVMWNIVVPYLWGIETDFYFTFRLLHCCRLYLTYEELKRFLCRCLYLFSISMLYLTYEELKRVHSFHKKHFVCMLHCTLPMRN